MKVTLEFKDVRLGWRTGAPIANFGMLRNSPLSRFPEGKCRRGEGIPPGIPPTPLEARGTPLQEGFQGALLKTPFLSPENM